MNKLINIDELSVREHREGETDTDDMAIEPTERLGIVLNDAAKWAGAFRQDAIVVGYSDMDEGWLINWFANVIEHTNGIRQQANRSRIRELEYLLQAILEADERGQGVPFQEAMDAAHKALRPKGIR